ncbi:DUF998 domain-containing protein [uncultured Pseudoteredinibacter sp.]|uniref:DUF998 domain-containing protein n=1 Tax=uncultured Pseudoteredinibacter sp. TaxID=1641701 RepID=UPI00262B996F|nr:DUF998 domain-containing protein [uncultured Pseudoteredinibacter sp.]
MLEQLFALSGLIATVWISLGVYIAAKFYPNYNHRRQFCSELGAAGSPTQTLSPLINNYPLGFIFCAFGGYLLALPENNWALTLSGVMIIVHGLGTWVAGFFPMDKDPYTETPSSACQIHSWAGFFMLLSLFIAPILIAFAPEKTFLPTWFRAVSILAVLLAGYFLYKLATVFNEKGAVGLYQRLSYWVQLIWLSLLSIQLALA